MRNLLNRQWTSTSILVGINCSFALVYLILIAAVMTYAALEVEFEQSVRQDEAKVATLEASYLAAVTSINSLDYSKEGYAKPIAEIFVSGARASAINIR